MTRSGRLMQSCIAVVLLLGFAATSNAGVVVDFTGGIAQSPGGDTVGGYDFRVSTSITVSGLGFWDEGANGLNHAHEVGLWTSAGTLLASVVVDNTSTPAGSTSPDGQWLFTSISSLVLTPGTYVIAATYLDQDPDQARLGTSPTSIPGVTVGNALQENPQSSLVFPTQDLGPGAILGPNLWVTAVPEPTTIATAAMGAICLVGFMARRRKGQVA